MSSWYKVSKEHHTHTHTHIVKTHDDVIKWKHFPRYWPFVRRIHRSLVNSPHKGQWRAELWCVLLSASEWMGRVNNREAGDLRRYRTHYDVSVLRGWPCDTRSNGIRSYSIKTLNLLNCFKDYIGCIHISYHILGLVQEKKTAFTMGQP